MGESASVMSRCSIGKRAATTRRLHGFPTSGHLFRNLIPALGDRNRVIAPDMPGFGNTVAPPRCGFEYGFDNLAKVIGLRRRDLASPAMRSTSLTMASR
jgi:pimeloyl-ACP methyl ester carboxylesterase